MRKKVNDRKRQGDSGDFVAGFFSSWQQREREGVRASKGRVLCVSVMIMKCKDVGYPT